MQPFGGGFGCFDRQRLQRMSFEVIAALLGFLGMFDHLLTGGHDEHCNVIAPAILRIEHVIAKAEAIRFGLTPEM